jgi:hypothetical protein
MTYRRLGALLDAGLAHLSMYGASAARRPTLTTDTLTAHRRSWPGSRGSCWGGSSPRSGLGATRPRPPLPSTHTSTSRTPSCARSCGTPWTWGSTAGCVGPSTQNCWTSGARPPCRDASPTDEERRVINFEHIDPYGAWALSAPPARPSTALVVFRWWCRSASRTPHTNNALTNSRTCSTVVLNMYANWRGR